MQELPETLEFLILIHSLINQIQMKTLFALLVFVALLTSCNQNVAYTVRDLATGYEMFLQNHPPVTGVEIKDTVLITRNIYLTGENVWEIDAAPTSWVETTNRKIVVIQKITDY